MTADTTHRTSVHTGAADRAGSLRADGAALLRRGLQLEPLELALRAGAAGDAGQHGNGKRGEVSSAEQRPWCSNREATSRLLEFTCFTTRVTPAEMAGVVSTRGVVRYWWGA